MTPTLTTARLVAGYVLALDQHGRQMPKYQGPYTEVRKLIERDYPDVEIELRPAKPLGVDGRMKP